MTASAADLFEAEQRDGARETARVSGPRRCHHPATAAARAQCGYCAALHESATGPLPAIESED